MLKPKRARRRGLSISMAPLIDMVFLLLIFFLLSSSFVLPSIRLQLPTGTNTDKEKSQEINITVDRNRNIYVNLEKVSERTLRPKLTDKMAEAGENVITFRCDGRIPYRFAVKIIDIAKQAGARDISLVHQIETEE